MKIRSIIYWAASLLIALYAATQAEASSVQVEGVLSPTALNFPNSATIPEIARSALLFIGIMAVAYTYRQAWLSFRRRAEA